MSININQAWKVNADGSSMQAITEIDNNDFSGLAENEQNKVYNSTRMLMAYAYYNNSGAAASVSETAKTCVDRSKPMPDFSYCFAGLGNESALSNIEYINFAPNLDGTFGKTYRDNNFNTPWCINAINKRGGTTPDGRIFGDTYPNNWNKDDNRTYHYCWKNSYNTNNPNDLTQYWNNGAYISANIEQMQNIALKNFILCIIVVAKRTYESTNVADVRIFDLYTYENTEHTNYPYVVGVYAVPFVKTNDTTGKRKPFVNTDSPIAPTISLSLFKELAISGNISYQISENEKYYYNDSMWREGLLNTAYFTGTNSVPPSFQNMVYSGDSAESTGCNISSVIPIMGTQFSQNSNEVFCVGVFSSNTNPSIILKFVPNTWNYYKWVNNSKWYHVWYRNYDETFYEECLKQVACFGLFFTDRLTVAINGECDNIRMYLGTLDSHNIGHGLYTSGQNNKKQKQWNWTNSEDADYSPSYNPPVPRTDPNTYNNNTGFNHPSAPQAFYDYYLLNGTQVENVKNELWNFDADFDPAEDLTFEEYLRDKFLTNNPIDLIVSLRKYPESHVVPPSPTDHVVIGKYTTSVMGYKLSSVSEEINLGSVAIFERFGGNFLDYECTQLFLYVPFCGICELDTSIYMGHTVKVKMFIDYTTGACTAYIICETPLGDLVTNTLDGKAAVDLAVSGLQTATLEQSLTAQKTSVKGNAGVAAAKAVVGAVETGVGAALAASGAGTPVGLGVAARGVSNVVSGLEGIRDALTDNYKLNHPVVSPQQIGASTALNSWTGELVPRLIIYRPVTNMYSGVGNDPAVLNVQQSEIYGHSQGFTDIRLGSIISNNLTGFVQMTNVDLSGISATATEKTEIINLLASGIYC